MATRGELCKSLKGIRSESRALKGVRQGTGISDLWLKKGWGRLKTYIPERKWLLQFRGETMDPGDTDRIW